MTRVPGRIVGQDRSGAPLYRPLLLVELRLPSTTPVGLDLVVDSGADYTVISETELSALGVDWSSLPIVPPTVGLGAVPLETRRCRGELWWEGKFLMDEFDVMQDLPASGVLGRDFFRTFTVDLRGWTHNVPFIRIERPGR
jgi:hypothetical protein